MKQNEPKTNARTIAPGRTPGGGIKDTRKRERKSLTCADGFETPRAKSTLIVLQILSLGGKGDRVCWRVGHFDGNRTDLVHLGDEAGGRKEGCVELG